MSDGQNPNEIIEQRLGLATGTQRRSDFDQIIAQIANGSETPLASRLQSTDESAPIWQSLIEVLAIGETYFFRDRAHFDLLRTQILPPLIQQRRQRGELVLSLCSFGCATGEEPYSLAILLRELLPDYEKWNLRLYGVDINVRALELARRAQYRLWSFRLNDESLFRYFQRTPDGYVLKPHVRDMVTFRQGNLFSAPALPQYDVIFCRNVLLYFTQQRAAAAESLLYEMLHPGGWLFLGQSEALRDNRKGWITHLYPGSPVYQKSTRADEAVVKEHRTKPVPVVRPPEPDPMVDYITAVEARHAGDLARAQDILRTLLAENPDHALGHMLLACTFADQRRTSDAHAHIDTALHLEPLLADAHYLRGILHLESGNPAQARQSLQYALYCQRSHPLAAFTLGTILANDGDIPRAVRLWQSILKVTQSLAPDSPISDFSDLTTHQLEIMIQNQLAGWTG